MDITSHMLTSSIELSSGDETTTDNSGARSKTGEPSSNPSCELCRLRKVKCDRRRPACTWCTRNNRACTYTEKRKRVPDSDLEVKLGRLDTLVHNLMQRVEDHIMLHDASLPDSGSPASNSMSIQDDHVSYPSQVHSSATPPEPVLTTTHPSGILLDYFTTPDGRNDTEIFGKEEIGLVAGLEFPPSDLLCTLIDIFFKHINTWYPLLDRKVTFDTYFGSTSMADGDRVVLHAIVAASLRFSTDNRLSSQVKLRIYTQSKQKVELYGLQNTDLYALKALSILALDELGRSHISSSRNLLALITRNIIHLDLCREKTVYIFSQDLTITDVTERGILSEPSSWAEDEGRRRLCWIVYLLDRYATVATSHRFMLPEDDVQLRLPCRYDLYLANIPVETRSCNLKNTSFAKYSMSKNENLGSFSYHCEILGILSRTHDFLTRPIDIGSTDHIRNWQKTFMSLEAELSLWLRNLPTEYGKLSLLCHSDPGARVVNWIMLQAAFVVSTIRLNSAAAYPAAQYPIFVPSYRAMQTCMSAMESLKNITQQVLEANTLSLLGPHFAFALWVSARLLLVHSATMDCELNTTVEFFTGVLEQMGHYWEIASNYAAILRRVTQEGRSGAKSFNEMRRCAYEITSLAASTRASNLEHTHTRNLSPSEFDYLDVFEFFNYPRFIDPEPSPTPINANFHFVNPQSSPTPTFGTNFMAPNLDSDWLHFENASS